MARDPFAEFSPEGAPKKGLKAKLDTGRVVTGLSLIVLVTFIFAFYLPLSGAHSALAEELETLSKSNSGTNTQLEKTTQQLMDTQKERDELKSKLDKVDAENAAADKKVDDLRAALEGKFDKSVKVEEVQGGAELVIDNLKLFRGHEVTVHPPGRKLLCAVGKALKGIDSEVEVRAYTSDGTVKNPILRRDYATAWDASAARAVGALRVLETCGVAGKRLRATGQAQHGVGELLKRSDGQVRLVLSPSK